MALNSSIKVTNEYPLVPAEDLPDIEQFPEDKEVLVRYLISGARRVLKCKGEKDLSTVIQNARRRLNAALYLLHGPANGHPASLISAPDWLHREKPENQAAFNEWIQATYLRVFRLERPLEEPMIPLDSIIIKGLTIYAARCGSTRFYAAWTELGGNFIGWMRIQPHISGIDSDYAVGEVLGRPVFMGISLDLSGHDALNKFIIALKEAAWDLGVADGI